MFCHLKIPGQKDQGESVSAWTSSYEPMEVCLMTIWSLTMIVTPFLIGSPKKNRGMDANGWVHMFIMFTLPQLESPTGIYWKHKALTFQFEKPLHVWVSLLIHSMISTPHWATPNRSVSAWCCPPNTGRKVCAAKKGSVPAFRLPMGSSG